MTPAPATPEQLAAIVDREIARQRSHGIGCIAASQKLHCHHSWAAIRASMLARLLGEPQPRRGWPLGRKRTA